MLFNSARFLLFFPAVTLIYFIIPHRWRYLWLLGASYYFYMCWSPRYALLMAASTLITWLSGLGLERAERFWGPGRRTRWKKLFVGFSFALNLGILFVFKYLDFALETLQRLLAAVGAQVALPALDLLLPVGISFYTFQALSYTVDVYRGDVKAEHNLLRYALFVSFFPQLVAGPIERSKELLGQLQEKHGFDFARAKSGVLLMLWGYFEKMVVADRAAIFVNQVFARYRACEGLTCVLAVVLFAIQVYCDFAGYSDIACGAAEVMGFRLMQNFRQPYFAHTLAEFWARWHISLSTWLQDYLFEPLVWSGWAQRLPLVGKRMKRPPVYSSLILTFLVSGLWHGASWTYVAWGALHGGLQVLGKLTKKLRRRVLRRLRVEVDQPCHRLLQQMLVFTSVCASYVFFRSASIRDALNFFGRVFSTPNPWVLFDGSLYCWGLDKLQWAVLLVAIAMLWLVDLWRGHADLRGQLERQCRPVRWTAYVGAVLLVAVFGVYGPQFDASRFIYFQF